MYSFYHFLEVVPAPVVVRTVVRVLPVFVFLVTEVVTPDDLVLSVIVVALPPVRTVFLVIFDIIYSFVGVYI